MQHEQDYRPFRWTLRLASTRCIIFSARLTKIIVSIKMIVLDMFAFGNLCIRHWYRHILVAPIW
jgi:hypothetical protein